MKISLIHPSRHRAAMADATIAEWLGKRSGLHPVEYTLSVDESDRQIADYRRLAERHGARLIVRPNRNMVQACNQAAQAASGDLLIMVSDDLGCPSGWDRDLALAVGDQWDTAVLVDDGLGAKAMALPIVGRAFYRRRGYLLFPGYIHHFSQNDLEGSARYLGKLVDARHLLFPHRHFTAGASPYDATHRAADLAWKHDAHLWRKRQVCDFGLRTPALRDVGARAGLELVYQRGRMQRLLLGGIRRVKSKFPILDATRVRLRKAGRGWMEFLSLLRQHLRRSRPTRHRPVPGTAERLSGRMFGRHGYVRTDRARGDVALLRHAAGRSQIVALRDCVVDRSRVRVRPGGGDMPPEFMPEEWGFAAFEQGALRLRDLGGLDPSRFRDYQRRLLSSAELASSNQADAEEPVTTFAIERREYFNLYHAITELYNAYVAIQQLAGAEPFNLLFLDGHCRGSLDTLWSDILKPSRVLRLHDYPGEAIRFRTLVLASGGYDSPLWGHGRIEACQPGDFLSDFIATVLAAYQVADPPGPERVLTFVDRRDYKPHPQSDGITTRKLDDLDFTVELLGRLYPRHRIEVRSFEDMPFRQQLGIVRRSDVLCGVHGAALTHVLFLRPNSELVEFAPPVARRNHIFRNLAAFMGIRYTRYLARNQRVLPNGKLVVRVTDEPI